MRRSTTAWRPSDMRELGAISREAEARLGCSVEQAALQARGSRHRLHDTVACFSSSFRITMSADEARSHLCAALS